MTNCPYPPSPLPQARQLMLCDRATLFLVGTNDKHEKELWSQVAINSPCIAHAP